MYAGQTGPCAHCGQSVTIPGKSFAPGGAKQSSGMSGVMIAVIIGLSLAGLCCVCVVPALLLPAVQGAREAARSTSCQNNLKQIGLALHNYHDVYRTMPPAVVTDENGRAMHSWRIFILPFLEADYIHSQYRFDEPWDSPNNSQFANQCPEVFRCPSDPNNTSNCGYRVVMGKNTAWQENKAMGFRDITDGTSNTIAVVEVSNYQSNWMDPNELQMDSIPMAINSPAGGIGSHHPDTVNILMFDASVRRLSEQLDPETLKLLLEHQDGKVIGGF